MYNNYLGWKVSTHLDTWEKVERYIAKMFLVHDTTSDPEFTGPTTSAFLSAMAYVTVAREMGIPCTLFMCVPDGDGGLTFHFQTSNEEIKRDTSFWEEGVIVETFISFIYGRPKVIGRRTVTLNEEGKLEYGPRINEKGEIESIESKESCLP